MTDKLRWSHDVASLGTTIVGNVDQGASGDWWAYGCMDEWEDTPLGTFTTQFQAKQAVARWVKEHQE